VMVGFGRDGMRRLLLGRHRVKANGEVGQPAEPVMRIP